MIKDLTHANNQKVKAALAEARDHGDVTWVKPLLEAYAGRQEDALREEMRDLLSTMKISSAEQVFADALVDSAMATSNQMCCRFCGIVDSRVTAVWYVSPKSQAKATFNKLWKGPR